MLSLRLATLTNLITRNMSGQMNALQPLLAHSLLIETTFFCGLFGAAVGWLQTRNEAHRDLWAFLIHRPITRTGIFWGKTVAGLGLYLFGAGLPLVVLVAVVRTPGHVAAPFEWAMLGPVVSISLTGGAYFFAGVLTGLRQARWYGSRGLGLGLAIAGSASVFAAMEFWQSLALIALVVLILATAVWGSYQSGGFYRGQAVTGRLALIAAMTAGCGGGPLCLGAGGAARDRRAHPTGVDHRQGNRRQRRGGKHDFPNPRKCEGRRNADRAAEGVPDILGDDRRHGGRGRTNRRATGHAAENRRHQRRGSGQLRHGHDVAARTGDDCFSGGRRRQHRDRDVLAADYHHGGSGLGRRGRQLRQSAYYCWAIEVSRRATDKNSRAI